MASSVFDFKQALADIDSGAIKQPLEGEKYFKSLVNLLGNLVELYNRTDDSHFPTTITVLDYVTDFPVRDKQEIEKLVKFLACICRLQITLRVTEENDGLKFTRTMEVFS